MCHVIPIESALKSGTFFPGPIAVTILTSHECCSAKISIPRGFPGVAIARPFRLNIVIILTLFRVPAEHGAYVALNNNF